MVKETMIQRWEGHFCRFRGSIIANRRAASSHTCQLHVMGRQFRGGVEDLDNG